MAMFRKKDEEFEDEYDDDEEEAGKKGSYQRRVIKNSQFKDLKKGNRKKRTEPVKPWGSRERLMVFFLILFTTGVSGYLALVARDFKLPGLPRFKMPVIAIPELFKEETIVIEGNRQNSQTAQAVIQKFEKRVSSLSGVYGFYVIRLSNGFSYGVNDDEVFQAASLIKLPVIAAMYQEAEAGNLDLDSTYILKQSDKKPGAGSLYSKPAGYKITYRNLIRLMGKESDNTAYNIAKGLLGEEKILETINDAGMVKTNLKRNETTPRDIGSFFERLWNGNLVSRENKEQMLEYLSDTAFEDWLVAGIPSDVKVSHKFGLELHVVNDAGVVFSQQPFVVVIMSKGIVEKEANTVIPDLAGIIYDFEVSDLE